MDIFLKATAGALISVFFCITLKKQNPEIATALAVLVCGIVVSLTITYIRPLVDFIYRLASVGQVDSEILQILLKITGVGLLSEVANLICADSGNASLGKALQILSCCVVLWLSLPLMDMLLDLINTILGEI